MRLKRKIDNYLLSWKNDSMHMPLIVRGARQIGKTDAIRNFGINNYKNYIEINFILEPKYLDIFENGYRKIPIFLGKDNKKFQISKVSSNAKSRDYIGVLEWLKNAGIINVCYSLKELSLPLKGNYYPDNYKVYFGDNGLLIGTLDEEAQEDLRNNSNFNTYKGAIYENIVADMLVKSGYDLYFYKNEKSTIEMDFFVRDKDSIIPIEVKANDNSTISLNKLINNEEIKYGIKLCNKNIGFNGKFYTFPYFLTFLLKRFLKDNK